MAHIDKTVNTSVAVSSTNSSMAPPSASPTEKSNLYIDEKSYYLLDISVSSIPQVLPVADVKPLPSNPIVKSTVVPETPNHHPEIPDMIYTSKYGQLIGGFFDEGVLLSPEEKQLIINIYLRRCKFPFLPLFLISDGIVSKPELSPDDLSSPPVEHKLKLFEKETVLQSLIFALRSF